MEFYFELQHRTMRKNLVSDVFCFVQLRVTDDADFKEDLPGNYSKYIGHITGDAIETDNNTPHPENRRS